MGNDGKTHVFHGIHTPFGRSILIDGVPIAFSLVEASMPANINSLVEGSLGGPSVPFVGWIQSVLIFRTPLLIDDWEKITRRLHSRWIATAPVVENWDPPVGSVISPEQPIRFDVVDDVEIVQTVIMARYPFGKYEVVFDGERFSDRFRSRSSHAPIPDPGPIKQGTRFQVRRFGLWPGNPTIEVRATNENGKTLFDSNAPGVLNAGLRTQARSFDLPPEIRFLSGPGAE